MATEATSDEKKSKGLKIVVLGAGAVGKSAITLRMVSNDFRKEYDPTIEDSYACSVMVDGKAEMLDILDTAGQEQFSSLLDHWIRDAEGFLLVYAINSFVSFEHAKKLYDKIQHNKEDSTINLILLGNKCDLPDNDRAVRFEDGKEYSNELNCTFFECSAKSNINIASAFEALVTNARKMNAPGPTASQSCPCVLL